jgi:uncharacterized Zn-finger protein
MADTANADTILVDARIVACDGGDSLGHPRVFLKIEDRDVTCPYCSRHYVLREGAGGGDHH